MNKKQPKDNQTKLLATEWARTFKKNEKLYLYFDKKLGLITKKEFELIEV